ncbi:MAG: biotin/lipoyl-binding protein [Clostridia bacterium]|nr:biotin/lipoyl-binding protein [Clostridia bacterium]
MIDMAKNYRITVNGNVYDVTVEETGVAAPAAVPAAAAAPVQTTVAAPAPKAAAGGGAPVKAPMNGTILKMNVKTGDSVKKDDVICILEAMKMENEIFAPQDGTVTAVVAPQGSAVNADDVIITLQ